MSTSPDPDLELKLTTEIAVAFLANNAIDRSTVGQLIVDIRSALAGPAQETARFEPRAGVDKDSAPPTNAAHGAAHEAEISPRAPAVPISQSITVDYLINLEDGKKYRSLRRHLMAKYNMTPDDYRRKWGLPPDYPMVAPSYARGRSEVAKRIGLGKKSGATAARQKQPR